MQEFLYAKYLSKLKYIKKIFFSLQLSFLYSKCVPTATKL